ncbi:MAG TPA: hypothetical protein VGG76_01540 [Gemmatimonadaceae bacterium]
MKSRFPKLSAATLILALGAAACSTDLSGPPALDDAQIDADIASASGATVASEVAGFTDNVAAAGSFSMVSPSFNVNVGSGTQPRLNGISPTCSYASGRYTCAATTEQGMSVSRSFAFYDAQGGSLQTFDSTKVESVNFQAQIDGNFQRDLVWSVGIHRTRNATVSGLISLKPQRKWNGVGAGADTVSHIGLDGIRSLAGTAADTVSNVLMPGKDAANQIPLSGSIVVAVDYTASLQGATGTASKEVKRRVVVTFDGTTSAALQVGSLNCVLHLDTKSVDSCQ